MLRDAQRQGITPKKKKKGGGKVSHKIAWMGVRSFVKSLSKTASLGV